MDYPLLIWCYESDIPPSLTEILTINLRSVLQAFTLPVAEVLHYRTQSTVLMSLFVAVNSDLSIIRVPAGVLSNITKKLNFKKLIKYSYISADPLCSFIPKSSILWGDPLIFGFSEGVTEFGRVYDLQKLKQEGYFAVNFPPDLHDSVLGLSSLPSNLLRELADLWGIEFIRQVVPTSPDILVGPFLIFRTKRMHLFDMPEEQWLNQNLKRILNDELPLVTIEGKWLSTSARSSANKLKILLSCLEFFREAKLPYITSSTFFCKVGRNLSVTCALGCVKDMIDLRNYLEENFSSNFADFGSSTIETNSAIEVAKRIYRKDPEKEGRAVAMKEKEGVWQVAYTKEFKPEHKEKNIEEELRKYYKISCQEDFGDTVNNLTSEELLKVVRIAECAKAKQGVCFKDDDQLLLKDGGEDGEIVGYSEHAYRHAIGVGSYNLSEKIVGIYKLGPYHSPFFPSYPVRVLPSLRYGLNLSEVIIRKTSEDPEDFLLKKIVGKIWLLSIYDKFSNLEVPTRYDVLQIATDKDESEVKDICYHAWSCGFLLGNWSKVMIQYKDKISVSVTGGINDRNIAQAADSIADGNRWLNLIKTTMEECAPGEDCTKITYTRTK